MKYFVFLIQNLFFQVKSSHPQVFLLVNLIIYLLRTFSSYLKPLFQFIYPNYNSIQVIPYFIYFIHLLFRETNFFNFQILE
jgi:hypothetical protein